MRSSPLREMFSTVRLVCGKYGVVLLQWMRNELSREQSSVVPNGKGILTEPQLVLQFGLGWFAACAAQRIATTKSSISSSRGWCFEECTAMTLVFWGSCKRSYIKVLYIEILRFSFFWETILIIISAEPSSCEIGHFVPTSFSLCLAVISPKQ